MSSENIDLSQYLLSCNQQIENSPNEIFLRETINRNFKKLNENDLKLRELYIKVIEKNINIHGYIEGASYDKGELVWFLGENKQNSEKTLYLLESIIDNNTNKPTLYLNEEKFWTFEPSYWKDKNELMSILENDLSGFSLKYFNQFLETYHSYVSKFHKFGELNKSKDFNDTKLILKDLSNIDINRPTNFYPYEVIPLQTNNIIQSGSYRLWHNGLIEYDIVFKLGNLGNEVYEYGNYDSISCNTFIPSDSSAVDKDNLTYNENSNYFFDENASKIFYKQFSGDELSVRIGGMIQHNRTENFNSYSGKIEFPVPFKDLNYMVFTSDIRCQERNSSSESIDPGNNTIIFTDKCKQSMVAIYMLRPISTKNNTKNNGLIVNSFHCQVIGKWK